MRSKASRSASLAPRVDELLHRFGLVAAAKQRPGRIDYSSGGNGSAAHITFEYLKLRARLFMLHIPYRGTAPLLVAAIAIAAMRDADPAAPAR